MTYPIRSTTQVADALALLTGALRGKPNVEAIVRAIVNRTQDLESAVWELTDALLLPATTHTAPLRDGTATYNVGDVVSLSSDPGAYLSGGPILTDPFGYFLKCTVAGLAFDPYPDALDPTNAAFQPHVGRTVQDGGVTWVYVYSGNPFGVWLDTLGELAGEPRGNRQDPEYLQAVRVRLRVNRSKGATQDVLDVLSLLALAAGTWGYYEDPQAPDKFRVDVTACAYPATVRGVLAKVRAAGTRAEFGYTPLARSAALIGGETSWGNGYTGSGTVFASVEEAK